VRRLAETWHRLKALWIDIWGIQPGPCIRLAGGLILKVMEHCAELRGGEGDKQQLTHAEAVEFTRIALAALASKDRREIAVSHDFLIIVDARTERIPESLFQRLYLQLVGENAIVSISSWSQKSVLSRARLETHLNEADRALKTTIRRI